MPIFRGFAIETQQTRLDGFAIEVQEARFHGFGVDLQVDAVAPPDTSALQSNQEQIACSGKVVQSKLVLSEATGGISLQAVSDENVEVLRLSQSGFVGFEEAELKLGGGAQNPAALVIEDENCKDSICLDGSQEGLLIAGCEYRDGTIEVRNNRDQRTVLLEGATGKMGIGGEGTGGELWVLSQNQTLVARDPNAAPLYMNGDSGTLTLNGSFLTGGVVWLRRQGEETMRLDWMQGVVEIQNADFAEEFEVAAGYTRTAVQPGTVVVLDDSGAIKPCSQAHDKKTVGIVSGAGSYKPGIVMDKQESTQLRLPVALAGKVYCWVETQDAAIREGDLLTTSPLSGHARKAGGLKEALGSVIGKALRPMKKGERGLIPVKVGLM